MVGDEVKGEVMGLFVRLLGLVKGKEKIARRLGGLFEGFVKRDLRAKFVFFFFFFFFFLSSSQCLIFFLDYVMLLLPLKNLSHWAPFLLVLFCYCYSCFLFLSIFLFLFLFFVHLCSCSSPPPLHSPFNPGNELMGRRKTLSI